MDNNETVAIHVPTNETNGTFVAIEGNETEKRTCAIMLFFPFSTGCERLDILDPPAVPFATDHFAAAIMAVDHFNRRNDVVAPELKELTRGCRTQLHILSAIDTEGHDGEGKASQAVIKKLVQQTRNEEEEQGEEEEGAVIDDGDDDEDHPICALTGVQCEDNALELAAAAASLDIPVTMYGSRDVTLSQTSRFPYVARTISNNIILGRQILYSLLNIGRAKYVTVFFNSDESSIQLRDYFEITANIAGTRLEFVTYGPATPMEIGMARIKEIGYRTVIVIPRASDQHLLDVAIAADGAGLLENNDYHFIIQNMHVNNIVQLANTYEAAAKLIKGAAHIADISNYEIDEDDRFLKEFQNWTQQESSLGVLQDLLPIQQPGTAGYVNVTDYYFGGGGIHVPTPGSAFAYDAALSIGLGACRAELNAQREADEENGNGGGGGGGGAKNQQGGGGGNRPATRRLKGEKLKTNPDTTHQARRALKAQKIRDNPRADDISNEHMKGIYQISFEGASGFNMRDPSRPKINDRDDGSTTMARFNFAVGEDGQTVVAKVTDILPGVAVTNLTRDIAFSPWTNVAPFVYADGTANQPMPLRNYPDENYLSTAAQVTVLTMVSLVLAFIVASVVFVSLKWKHSAVKGAQPEFLLTMLAGAALFVSSIFALSFDEEDNRSTSSLSAACAASPWLLVLGYLTIHGSLFSKLWRINQVLQFRRSRKVSIKAVLGPFVLIILTAVALLSAWTAVEPLYWYREEIDLETGDSSGSCHSNCSQRFWIPIAVLMAFATLMTCTMAWWTRDVDSRFAESNFILITLFVQVQILVVGLPVLFLIESGNSDVVYVARSLLILLIAATAVGIMVAPKMMAVFRPKNNDANSRQKRGTMGSVVCVSAPNTSNTTVLGLTDSGSARKVPAPSRTSNTTVSGLTDSKTEFSVGKKETSEFYKSSSSGIAEGTDTSALPPETEAGASSGIAKATDTSNTGGSGPTESGVAKKETTEFNKSSSSGITEGTDTSALPSEPEAGASSGIAQVTEYLGAAAGD